MSTISSTTGSASDLRGEYLNLLITQLRYQNPLEPMDNEQMTSQLAQLSQLELLEGMSSTFEKTLLATELNQATALIDKQVAFFPQDGLNAVAGTVEGVNIHDGKVLLTVGSYIVGLDEIVAITK